LIRKISHNRRLCILMALLAAASVYMLIWAGYLFSMTLHSTWGTVRAMTAAQYRNSAIAVCYFMPALAAVCVVHGFINLLVQTGSHRRPLPMWLSMVRAAGFVFFGFNLMAICGFLIMYFAGPSAAGMVARFRLTDPSAVCLGELFLLIPLGVASVLSGMAYDVVMMRLSLPAGDSDREVGIEN